MARSSVARRAFTLRAKGFSRRQVVKAKNLV